MKHAPMMRRLLGGSPGVSLQHLGDRDMEAWEGEGQGEAGVKLDLEGYKPRPCERGET